MTAATPSRSSALADWLASTGEPDIPVDAALAEGLRFLFYGRASTREHQDPRTSRGWQFDVSCALVEGHGTIVGEYFEVGYSRQVPLHRRPQLKALLCHIAANPGRVDAVVVGEFERVFFNNAQVRALWAALSHYGVRLWLPEADGAVDFDSPEHQALLKLLALRSRHEVLRSRRRVMAAMRRQAVEQGRYLGGRPPYGYMLVDVGVHPNRALALRGVLLQQLAPNPDTAPVVKLIFVLRLAGRSAASIARELNERGVPSPSEADPARNPHRLGCGWSLRSVVEILRNPRYTGRQVWNRTSADRATCSPSGRRASVRNGHRDWVVSKRVTHPPLVSEQDFVAAQDIRSAKENAGDSEPIYGGRTYLLARRLQCAVCRRVMDSHWSHGRATYRCRHGYNSSHSRPEDAPRNLYLREDHLLERIAAYLTTAGIADRPGPEQTARLVAELGFTFRCDENSVTPVRQALVSVRPRKTRKRPASSPIRRKDETRLLLELMHDAEPCDRDEPDGHPRGG
ncbi:MULTISPECIES: recombinase family protein [Actinosynnema]|uniref:recombinase family protein n=1 Tax=Actinosynnema TaxID=40566 RepID=UPI0020A4622D|nr:recombinase family protein [Actinosynnema pretiosum]MCP2099993.1 Resolvase, N terminal domain [Actinosynnema pretiosum]